jgi:hypothetical protein
MSDTDWAMLARSGVDDDAAGELCPTVLPEVSARDPEAGLEEPSVPISNHPRVLIRPVGAQDSAPSSAGCCPQGSSPFPFVLFDAVPSLPSDFAGAGGTRWT